MKKLNLILVLFVFASASLFAKKNDWEIGVGLQMINHSDDLKEIFEPGFGLNFNVGKFVSEKVLVGGQYTGNFIPGKNNKNYANSGYNLENWGMNHDITGYGRLYFFNVQRNISPFVGLEAGYSMVTTSLRLKDDAGNQYEKAEESYSFGLIAPSAGCSFPLSYSTSLNLILKYTWTFDNSNTDPYGYGYGNNSNLTKFKHFDLQLTFNFLL